MYRKTQVPDSRALSTYAVVNRWITSAEVDVLQQAEPNQYAASTAPRLKAFMQSFRTKQRPQLHVLLTTYLILDCIVLTYNHRSSEEYLEKEKNKFRVVVNSCMILGRIVLIYNHLSSGEYMEKEGNKFRIALVPVSWQVLRFSQELRRES